MSLDFGRRGVHVLITGAAGGIGLETVKTIQYLGARITAHYNTHIDIGDLQNLKDIVTLQADVRDASSVSELLAAASKQNRGPVSILICNHGIWPQAPTSIGSMSLCQWQNALATNLTGPFSSAARVFPTCAPPRTP